MNGQILTDDMSLDEKLKVIEQAMQNAQEEAEAEAKQKGVAFVPIDPSDLTICDGCQ